MALFDSLGDNASGLYGNIFDDQQKAALGQRGLLGFLGGLANSGALDYTVPTISGKMPGGFAKGLAGGMSGMGEAQDAAAMNALKAQLVGLQGKDLESKIGVRNAFMGSTSDIAKLLGQLGIGAAPPSSNATLPAAGGQTLANGAAGASGGYGISDLYALAVKAGYAPGEPAAKAASIAMAESSGNPLAHNTKDEDSYGLMQLNADAHGDKAKTFDPFENMQRSVDISKGGTDWSPWTMYKNGTYKQYMPAALQAAASMSQQSRPVQLASAAGNSDLPQSAVDAATQALASRASQTPGAADMSAIPRATPGTNITVPGMPQSAPPPGGPDAIMPQAGQGAPDPRAMLARVLAGGGAGAQAAPPGAQMAQAAPPMAQIPMGAPQGAPAAPTMLPGSSGMNPAQAQKLQQLLPLLGLADAQGAAAGIGNPYQNLIQVLQGSPSYKSAVAAAEAQGKLPFTMENIRQGGSGWMFNPATNQFELKAQAPKLPEGYMLQQGPNGQMAAVPVPGALEGARAAAQAQAGGRAAYEPQPVMLPSGAPGVLPRSQVLDAGVPIQTGLSPQERAAQEATGTEGVRYGGLLPPQAPAFPMGTAMPSPTAPAQPPTQPVPTPRGTLLPPPSEQTIPQSPAELDKAIPTWAKKVEDWTSGIDSARQAEQRLSTIAKAMQQVETGPFTAAKSQVALNLRALGMPGLANQIMSASDAAQASLMLHENAVDTLKTLKATTSRFTQQEFQTIRSQTEHPDLPPEANRKMLAEDLATMRDIISLPQDWNDAQKMGWRNPISFEAARSEINPMGKRVEAIEKEIGPLKGMEAPTNPTATLGGITYEKRDGKWYPK